MSHDSLRIQLVLWVLVALGVVGLAVGRSVSGAIRPIPPPMLGTVPEFSLTDQQGRPFGRTQLDGSVWVADFIFTSCAGQCVMMSDQMRALQRAFAKEDGVRFLSFSVDPSHDTPRVLRAYAQQHGGDPRWRLLTGEREALHALSVQGFHLAIAEEAVSSDRGRAPTKWVADGSADSRRVSAREPIVHSVRFVLIDRHGAIRGYYEATSGQAVARLRADVRRLLQEPP